jgi:hypothetical protein
MPFAKQKTKKLKKPFNLENTEFDSWWLTDEDIQKKISEYNSLNTDSDKKKKLLQELKDYYNEQQKKNKDIEEENIDNLMEKDPSKKRGTNYNLIKQIEKILDENRTPNTDSVEKARKRLDAL